tara:strand:+ start:27 stop:1679 length:1653 start_codon:yes stop_codon:yes gene_type:complete
MHNLPNYWINAKNIKNYILDDPLLDWLNIYGQENGFEFDRQKKDLFKEFIRNKSENFKQMILNNIVSQHIIDKKLPLRSRVSLTSKYIIEGKDIIVNGELFDNEINIYGSCDIIVRSDKINKIFKTQYEYEKKPCSLHNNFHYVIINMKCIKIKISKKMNILNTKKNMVFKSESIILNRCLGKIQGYTPDKCFIIGDKYEINNTITSDVEYVAEINIEEEKELNKKIENSIQWLKELYLYGKNWQIYPPSRNELYPNMCNTENDFPWNKIKKEIAIKLNEITLLWNCGKKQRDLFHKEGIYEWTDHNFNTDKLSFNKDKKKIISKMVDINHYYNDSLSVYPRKIKKKQNIKILTQDEVEFIVDFETINMEDNEKQFNGIFMIGCFVNFKDKKKNEFNQFIAKDLTDEEEKKIITEWIDYMNFFEEKFNLKSKIFHWGKAEQSIYKQVTSKFEFKKLNFIDLLDVFKTEPIIVKDSFSYGLKDIVKALHKHGIIKEIWEEEMNGKEAMIQAWKQYNSKSKKQNNIMNNIGKYNYYDCKVIDEILVFIRNML